MRDYFMKHSPIRFADFIDGDCVNSRDGRLTADGLVLSLAVEAPAGHTVTLNGAPMLFYQAYYADCLYLDRQADDKEAEGFYQKYLAMTEFLWYSVVHRTGK